MKKVPLSVRMKEEVEGVLRGEKWEDALAEAPMLIIREYRWHPEASVANSRRLRTSSLSFQRTTFWPLPELGSVFQFWVVIFEHPYMDMFRPAAWGRFTSKAVADLIEVAPQQGTRTGIPDQMR